VSDDTALLQGFIDQGEPVPPGTYRLTGPLVLRDGAACVGSRSAGAAGQ
jgi:hypothetical protein